MAAAAWVAAVLLGSGLAWVAVDRAGRAVLEPVAASGVGSESAAGTSAGTGTAGSPEASASAAVPPAPVLTTAVPPPASDPGAAAPRSLAGAPADASTAAGSQPDAGGEPDRAPAAEPAPAPAPEPAAVTATRSTAGGVLAVTCRGDVASLSYATPASGWSVDVGDDSGEVRAEFTTGQGGDERGIDVRATCVGGAPSFVVEED